MLGFELQRLQPRWRRGTAAASFGAQGGGSYRMLGTTGQGESGQWLTAELQGWLAGSGTSGSSRFDGDDLRWPRRGTATWAAMQGFRRPVKQWGGRGGRGGASGLVGGAREGRWLQLRRSMSAAALCFGRGGEGGEAGREGRGARESEGGQGDRDGLRKSSTRPGARRQAGAGRTAVRVRARSSFGARGGRRRRAAVVGWAACWLGQTGRSPGKLLLLFISVF